MTPAPTREQAQEQEETNDIAPFQGGVGSALAALRERLATDAPHLDLHDLGDPARLHLLFHLELCALVRGGPENGGRERLHRLLAVAGQAAARGDLLLATPVALRGALAALSAELHQSDIWAEDHPLWWAPLPQPATLEDLWRRLARRRGALLSFPEPVSLAAAFTGLGAPRYLLRPSFLTPALTSRLHRELELAWETRRLRLDRAGVGAGGTITVQRSDEVHYVDGTEPALLAAAPALAVLVQWGLRHLGARLTPALLGTEAHPPQKAMLARYPAPSQGYEAHLDNPGGKDDNGRLLTLVLYLNGPDARCRGGELEVWTPGTSTAKPPTQTLSAGTGAAALFDSRLIPHRVRPLAAGPARWALTFWLNDAPQAPSLMPPPRPTQRDVLLPITAPPLPPRKVLFHSFDDGDPAGQIEVLTVPAAQPRVGLVATVYRAGSDLDTWCAHHLALGFDHLIVIFDHLEDADEGADAARLRTAHPATRLTTWSGAELAATSWRTVDDLELRGLRTIADGGGSSHAVAARQTLNASAALAAARGNALGGAPLDWLLHLDADELFYLEGSGRGGATLHDHFAAASGADLHLMRYLNHELLLPLPASTALRCKRNPRLGAARLGTIGWEKLVTHLKMGQKDRRPYFNSYHNGKSAVYVGAAKAAAGVHSWALDDSTASRRCVLAGPSVLHLHCPSAQHFREKYLSKAAAPAVDEAPFAASPMESAALALIHRLEADNADRETMAEHLDALYASLTGFSDDEIELLAEAGLIFQPDLEPYDVEIP